MEHLFSILNPSLLKSNSKLLNERLVFYPKTLAKAGNIDLNDIPACLGNSNLPKIEIQLDRPFFDEDFKDLKWLNTFDSGTTILRVEDLGLADFLSKNYPQFAIALILNSHSKTLPAWQRWASALPSLCKLIISPEISYRDLAIDILAFKKDFPAIKFELLAAGKISLYYSLRDYGTTPGNYRMQQLDKPGVPDLKVTSAEDEFIIYFGSDLFICNLADELAASAIDQARVELSKLEHFEVINSLYPKAGWQDELLRNWGSKTTSGFFHRNRTDLPLKLIKNRNLESIELNHIGQVLEYVPQSHILFELFSKITLPIKIMIITPDGIEISHDLEVVQALSGENKNGVLEVGQYLMPAIKRAVHKSKIFMI